MRQGDIACRYGGEEFLITSPGLGMEKARERAEKIRALVEDMVTEFEENKIQVTISVGIASFPEHGIDVDDLLNKADQALYQAKRMGRNMVMVYSQEFEAKN